MRLIVVLLKLIIFLFVLATSFYPKSPFNISRHLIAQEEPFGRTSQPNDTTTGTFDGSNVLRFPQLPGMKNQPPGNTNPTSNAGFVDNAVSSSNTGTANNTKPGSNVVTLIGRPELEELHRHIQDPNSPRHVEAVLSYAQKGLSGTPIKPALWAIVKNPLSQQEDSTTAMELLKAKADKSSDPATPTHLAEIIQNRQIATRIRDSAIDIMLDNYFTASLSLTIAPSHQRFPELLLSLAANPQEDSYIQRCALMAFRRYNIQNPDTHLGLLHIINTPNDEPSLKEMAIKAINNPDLTNPQIVSLLLNILADHLYTESMDSIGWEAKSRLSNHRGGHIPQLIDIMHDSDRSIELRTAAITVLGAIGRSYDQEIETRIERGESIIRYQQSLPIEILMIYPGLFSLAEDTAQDTNIRMAAFDELKASNNLKYDETHANHVRAWASTLKINPQQFMEHCATLKRGFDQHAQHLLIKPSNPSATTSHRNRGF